MDRRVLYAYVDGADLDEIEHDLEAAFTTFVAQHTWTRSLVPCVVNQRHPGDDIRRPGERPAWDLGLNMPLSDSSEADLCDIEAIVTFLHELALRTKREFVVGIATPATRRDRGRNLR